jgi:hypothetical protein
MQYAFNKNMQYAFNKKKLQELIEKYPQSKDQLQEMLKTAEEQKILYLDLDVIEDIALGESISVTAVIDRLLIEQERI